MNKANMAQYLNRKAEKWVSSFVLVGCVAITGALFFTAVQAQALGDRFAEKTGFGPSL